ncbi:MAG: DNA-3-methyladenine glycosylase 2 family protein [Dehalococcoidia bacterium]|nr:DNA-3-methyladenine glycosylase 2 family protein [Dehalococcoidia bacterium]
MSSRLTKKEWEYGIKYLTEVDNVLGDIIQKFPKSKIQFKNNAFKTLTQSIVGQQISIKAAASIWSRLETLLDGQITQQNIINIKETKLKKIGLSRQKISYLKDLSNSNIESTSWNSLTDEEVINEITKIKGIGIWTAQMFLIFHLGRKNVLPLADIGLLNAIEKNYNIPARTNLKSIEKISNRWIPWQTIATWYLWKSVDTVDVEY